MVQRVMPVNIAVFADVHGRILLCFKLSARWERETGEKIDLILQCGDMGIFPDLSRLDGGTKKHAKKDPKELGYFYHFAELGREALSAFKLLKCRREAEAVLRATTCNLIFVRGNHEDHLFLDRLESRTAEPVFPVDVYQRLGCLKTGEVFEFRARGEALRILGIGRIAPGREDASQKLRKPKYIQQHEEDRLFELLEAVMEKQSRKCKPSGVDVLLTHEPPPGLVTLGEGSEYVRLALDALKPCYHFFGHVRRPCNPVVDANGVTVSAKMANLDWEENRGRSLPRGVMGLLRWQDRKHHSFDIVDEPWMREYTACTWKYL